VIQVTEKVVLKQHDSPMCKLELHSPKIIRTLITILIWISAAVVMSACSTHIKEVPQAKPAQQNTAIEKAPEAAPASISESKPTPVKAIEEATLTKKKAALKVPVFSNVLQKKNHFFTFMKPIVMAENQNITQQRQQILALQKKKQLSDQDILLLTGLAKSYRITPTSAPDASFWKAILERVDIIPVELALVQAANESAWGTSRFARDGNNYFGQWCFKKGCGIVPGERSIGASHEVRRFEHAKESVQAYMKNINTSRAYKTLRKMRTDLRQQQRPIQAELLANGLKHYSERGMAYVKTIQSMIRSNRKLIAKAGQSQTSSG